MSWPCPQCGASCRTPESLGIHVGRCRAMSVEEIRDLVLHGLGGFSTHDGIDLQEMCDNEIADTVAKAIHAHHIAKLRGKKNA